MRRFQISLRNIDLLLRTDRLEIGVRDTRVRRNGDGGGSEALSVLVCYRSIHKRAILTPKIDRITCVQLGDDRCRFYGLAANMGQALARGAIGLNKRNERLRRDPNLRFGLLNAGNRRADVEIEASSQLYQLGQLLRLKDREIVGRRRRPRWICALTDIGVGNLDLWRGHMRIEECTPAKQQKPGHSRYSGTPVSLPTRFMSRAPALHARSI